MSTIPFLAVAGLCLLSTAAPGQILRFLKDIDPQAARPSSRRPRDLTVAGALTFFVFPGRNEGDELWVTDGTEKGTKLVKDIRPGPFGSVPTELTALGGKLVFLADDGVHGREPWVSDGTTGGTRLLKDVRPGPAASVGGSGLLTAGPTTVFFRANDGVTGLEVWRTNGTPKTTELMHDIRAGAPGSNPLDLTPNDAGGIFLTAEDGKRGRELIRIKASGGLFGLPETIVGPGSANPRRLARAAKKKILFTADFPSSGRELFVLEDDKIRRVADLRPGKDGSDPNEFVVAGTRVFFVADNGKTGRELFVFEKNAARLTKDIRPGNASPVIQSITALGDRVVFVATDLVSGREPFISDGTAAGTKLLKDIRTGSGSSFPAEFVSIGSRVFFTANDGLIGTEPWSTDGTAAGTQPLVDIDPLGNSTPRFIVGVANRIFAVANTRVAATQVVRIDPAKKTFAIVRRLGFTTFGSDPQGLIALKGTNTVLFSAFSRATGRELFKSDGTTQGTVLVKDIQPGAVSSSPGDFVEIDGVVFFAAGTARNLFRSDGTAAGTRAVTSGLFRVKQLVRFGELIVFVADDGTTGDEPFVLDPKTGAFQLLRDIRPGRLGSGPRGLTATDDAVFFSASDDQTGDELHKTDGTPRGTVLVKDGRPGRGGTEPKEITSLGDRVVFAAKANGARGFVLWSSFGTAATTDPVKPGGGFLEEPSDIVRFLGKKPRALLSATRNGDTELFSTNGTGGGTQRVRDINPTGSSDPSGLVAAGRRVYFSADPGVGGRELFHSDAKDAVRVMNLRPGPLPSIVAPETIARLGAGAQALFVANDGLTGFELYTTAGSKQTTRLLADVVPGAESFSPIRIVNAGALAYVVGDDGVTGNELYVLDMRNLQASLAIKFGKTCAAKGKTPPRIGHEGIPEVGSLDFALTVKRARKKTATVLFFGAQRINVRIGSCQLSVATIFSLFGVTDDNGTGTFTIPIPNDVRLVGITAQTQFAVLDPQGEILGLLNLSDALEFVVGKKSD